MLILHITNHTQSLTKKWRSYMHWSTFWRCSRLLQVWQNLSWQQGAQLPGSCRHRGNPIFWSRASSSVRHRAFPALPFYHVSTWIRNPAWIDFHRRRRSVVARLAVRTKCSQVWGTINKWIVVLKVCEEPWVAHCLEFSNICNSSCDCTLRYNDLEKR